MASLSWRMLLAAPEGVGARVRSPTESLTKPSSLPVLPQAREQEEGKLGATCIPVSIARRNILLYMTSGALGVSFLTVNPAKAENRRLENKRKVFEKLQKLKDKATVPGTNAENKGNSTSGAAPSREGSGRRPAITPGFEAQLP